MADPNPLQEATDQALKQAKLALGPHQESVIAAALIAVAYAIRELARK